MEAALLPSSPDHSVSPNKQKTSPRKNKNVSISRTYENFTHSNHLLNIDGSPAYLSSSFSSSIPAFNKKQPPLLPLPISYFSLSAQNNRGGLLSPPTGRKLNNSWDVTPKKPKSSRSPKKKNHMKHDSKSIITTTQTNSEASVMAVTNRLGPDPIDLPKEVSRVLKPVVSSSTSNVVSVTNAKLGVEELSGSILFSLGPPPSCVPLPKFSLKPKLRCNVEAGGIDAGATDNLRRILRLQ